jgi:hypothetical protein
LRHLRKTLEVVVGFAAAGFIVPWFLLAFYIIAHRMGYDPSTTPALYLCPFSFWALGLEKASLAQALVVWLIMSLFNAGLYAIPGLLVGTAMGIVRLWKSN